MRAPTHQPHPIILLHRDKVRHYTACSASWPFCSSLLLARDTRHSDRALRVQGFDSRGQAMNHAHPIRQLPDAAVAPRYDTTRRSSARPLLGAGQADCRSTTLRPGIPTRLLILGYLLAGLISACSNDGQGAVATSTASGEPPPLSPPGPNQAWTGHYVGAIKIAGTAFFGDGVITQDGVVRLYVGGPYDSDGVLQTARPDGSVQFIGTIQVRNGTWSGDGVIIGEECAINAANRFCNQTTPAEVSGTVQADAEGGTEIIRGEIRVAAASGKETWSVDLVLWPDFGALAATGQYREMVAEFAYANDVIMTVDDSGRLFFQSAASGCVGNGTLVPTRNDSAGASAATLVMESCSGAYSYLNGTYEGLAVITPSSRWDYDALLRIWLSKPSGATPPAALTILGEPLPSACVIPAQARGETRVSAHKENSGTLRSPPAQPPARRLANAVLTRTGACTIAYAENTIRTRATA